MSYLFEKERDQKRLHCDFLNFYIKTNKKGSVVAASFLECFIDFLELRKLVSNYPIINLFAHTFVDLVVEPQVMGKNTLTLFVGKIV